MGQIGVGVVRDLVFPLLNYKADGSGVGRLAGDGDVDTRNEHGFQGPLPLTCNINADPKVTNRRE